MRIITFLFLFACFMNVAPLLDKRITDYLLQHLQRKGDDCCKTGVHDNVKFFLSPNMGDDVQEIASNDFDATNNLSYDDTEDVDLLRQRIVRATTRATTRVTPRKATTKKATAKTVRTTARPAVTKAAQKANQNVRQTQNTYVKVGNTYNEVASSIVINLDLRLKKSMADAPRIAVPPPLPGRPYAH